MPGIRVNTPVGDDWEYSLDTVNWQPSPVFYKAATNVDFVVGTDYVVYCRNQPANLLDLAKITFGQKTNDPTLPNLYAKATLAEKAQFLKGLLETAGTEIWQLICAGLKGVDCGCGSTEQIEPVFQFQDHFAQSNGKANYGLITNIGAGVTGWLQGESRYYPYAGNLTCDQAETLFNLLPLAQQIALTTKNEPAAATGTSWAVRNCSGGIDPVLVPVFVFGTDYEAVADAVTDSTYVTAEDADFAEINHAPVTKIIPDFVVTGAGDQIIELPLDMFTDEDGTQFLAITAGQIVNATTTTPLPATLQLSLGVPNVLIVKSTFANGQIAIRFTATDPGGLSVSQDRLLTVNRAVTPANPAPTAPSLPDQEFFTATPGDLTFTVAAFTDTDALTYAATQTDGSALPTGISFDAATRKFTITEQYLNGIVNIKVTATDTANQSVSSNFKLTVGRNVQVGQHDFTNASSVDAQELTNPNGGTWTVVAGTKYTQTSNATSSQGYMALWNGQNTNFPGAGTVHQLQAELRVTRAGTGAPGIGIRCSATTGFALLLMPDQTHVQFINQGVASGPAFAFNWQVNVLYQMRLIYQETPNGKARVLARVWPSTQSEPSDFPYQWLDVDRIDGGYPALYGGGGASGTTTTVEFTRYAVGVEPFNRIPIWT